MKTANEIRTSREQAGSGRATPGGSGHSRWRFFGNYLALIVAMMVGMMVVYAGTEPHWRSRA